MPKYIDRISRALRKAYDLRDGTQLYASILEDNDGDGSVTYVVYDESKIYLRLDFNPELTFFIFHLNVDDLQAVGSVPLNIGEIVERNPVKNIENSDESFEQWVINGDLFHYFTFAVKGLTMGRLNLDENTPHNVLQVILRLNEDELDKGLDGHTADLIHNYQEPVTNALFMVWTLLPMVYEEMVADGYIQP